MLRNIPNTYFKSVMRLFQFILYSERPLTVKEAVEIIATDVENEPPCFSVDSRLFDDNDILTCCSSLVSIISVDNKAETKHELHLAHFSVKEYLLLQRNFERIDASITITKTCLIYLRDICGHQWRLAKEFFLAEYAAQVWMGFGATAESSEDVLALIIKLFQSEEAFQRWIFLCEASQGRTKDPSESRLYYACHRWTC